MNVKAEKDNLKIQKEKPSLNQIINLNMDKNIIESNTDNEFVNLCDENLVTLQKIHAILLHCSNLSKKQKLEFCESERYFMKLYLRKVKDQID